MLCNVQWSVKKIAENRFWLILSLSTSKSIFESDKKHLRDLVDFRCRNNSTNYEINLKFEKIFKYFQGSASKKTTSTTMSLQTVIKQKRALVIDVNTTTSITKLMKTLERSVLYILCSEPTVYVSKIEMALACYTKNEKIFEWTQKQKLVKECSREMASNNIKPNARKISKQCKKYGVT